MNIDEMSSRKCLVRWDGGVGGLYPRCCSVVQVVRGRNITSVNKNNTANAGSGAAESIDIRSRFSREREKKEFGASFGPDPRGAE